MDLVIKTPFSNKRSIHNYIMNIPADAKSYSAHLLLHDKLRRLDPEKNWKQVLKKYIKFRFKLLTELTDIHGRLTCTYCGRNDLVIGFPKINNKNNRIPNLATIDHIYPVSLGGGRLDKTNCTVACKRCNGTKGDTIL